MTAPTVLCPRLAEVQERIERAGGDLSRLRIVAVTKGFGPETVRAAVEAGLVDLGENYAQELSLKAATAPPDARWHFLGSVQRNKLARLAPLVSWWHGIDRDAAVDALAARSGRVTVLLQVNASGDPAKHGCRIDEVPALARRCRERGLDLRGLMVVGVAGDRHATRGAFRAVGALADRLGLAERSMGMSDDFEMAVQEGATVLRLGRVLFGPRPGPPGVRR
ncbi:MAG: YggS family pyridoxal phosphate enzyme [Acidimicrobiales bacterium]